jgi:WD40 repeat protein
MLENTTSKVTLSLRGKVFIVEKDILTNAKGTYFNGLLSSGVWQPNSDGVYVIDRPSEGFDRILDCLETGNLSCKGLTDYEIDCAYGNLDYFLIPFTRVWDYSIVQQFERKNLTFRIQLEDGRFCGSTSDHSICIYNMDTNIIERSMTGHTDHIYSIIRLDCGLLCSCSDDKTIKLWDIESGQCELTIDGHTQCVNCVIQLIDGRLCSGSGDSTIKIWNTDTGDCEVTIIAGDDIVCLVQLRDSRICSGDYDFIYIWNVSTGVCELTLKRHADFIWAIVVIDELRICSRSNDNEIKVWNVITGVCEINFDGHTDAVIDMVLLLDGRLCSISFDGNAKIWNTYTGICDCSVRIGIRTSIFGLIQTVT